MRPLPPRAAASGENHIKSLEPQSELEALQGQEPRFQRNTVAKQEGSQILSPPTHPSLSSAAHWLNPGEAKGTAVAVIRDWKIGQGGPTGQGAGQRSKGSKWGVRSRTKVKTHRPVRAELNLLGSQSSCVKLCSHFISFLNTQFTISILLLWKYSHIQKSERVLEWTRIYSPHGFYHWSFYYLLYHLCIAYVFTSLPNHQAGNLIFYVFQYTFQTSVHLSLNTSAAYHLLSSTLTAITLQLLLSSTVHRHGYSIYAHTHRHV